jgi:uncharacterized membrane protein
MKQCNRTTDCSLCHRADQTEVYNMIAVSDQAALSASSAIAQNSYNVNVHYIKMTAGELPISTKLAALTSRKDHLAQKLGNMYVLYGIYPNDARSLIIDKLRSQLPQATYTELKDMYDNILIDAEKKYQTLTDARFYIDETSLLRKLTLMTKAEFVTEFLNPLHDIYVSSKILKNRMFNNVEIKRSRTNLNHALCDAGIANIVILSVLLIAFILYTKLWKSNDVMSMDSKSIFSLQIVIFIVIIVFLIILIWSWKDKSIKDKEASQKSATDSATKLLRNSQSLFDFVHSADRGEWVKTILSVPVLKIDEITGNIYISPNGERIDIKNKKFKDEKLEMHSLGDNQFAFASEIRNLLISVDQTINNCNEYLDIKQEIVFPWNEVMMLLLGLVLVAAMIVITSRYIRPQSVSERLRSLIQKTKWDESEFTVDIDDSKDFIMQIIMMIGTIVMLLVMSVMIAKSARDYQSSKGVCKKNNRN